MTSLPGKLKWVDESGWMLSIFLSSLMTVNYPQVVLAFGYRMYNWFADVMKIQTKVCYTVNRGYNQPPVESCEGIFIYPNSCLLNPPYNSPYNYFA